MTTGECECPENTVGRTCLPCQCNNNTDKCLRTGECLECQFNTTGFYCQHCDTGTFGNAVDQQCQGKVIACNTTKNMTPCKEVRAKSLINTELARTATYVMMMEAKIIRPWNFLSFIFLIKIQTVFCVSMEF